MAPTFKGPFVLRVKALSRKPSAFARLGEERHRRWPGQGEGVAANHRDLAFRVWGFGFRVLG